MSYYDERARESFRAIMRDAQASLEIEPTGGTFGFVLPNGVKLGKLGARAYADFQINFVAAMMQYDKVCKLDARKAGFNNWDIELQLARNLEGQAKQSLMQLAQAVMSGL